MHARKTADKSQTLHIGWAQADITPAETCQLCGQFYSRLSEGVLDPVTATALVLESPTDHVVFVSCDLVGVPDPFRDAVRAQLGDVDGLDPTKVVLNATHTHTAPDVRLPNWSSGTTSTTLGIDFECEVLSVEQYQAFASERIADAVRKAWAARSPGSVAFGHGWAVVGHNRRWVDTEGKATMYGKTDVPHFSHIEGYEDHRLGLVATYDPAGKLTGLVVNVPCPSQVSEHLFQISADYWCETRAELRKRLGKDLFVLPQCSAAGDQSPHPILTKRSEERMLQLKGLSERQEIARRIADAVDDVLPVIAPTADALPHLAHHVVTIDLPMNALTEADVKTALAEADKLRALYDEEMRKLDADPSLKDDPRWYKAPTAHFRMMRWYQGVAERFEKQKTQSTQPVELHVLRLGDLAMATNPFEFYLDFGIRIKARSAAIETFLVQLAGGGTYCPSPRSLAGGGYGSLPASNPVGPEGGRMIVERTVETIGRLWQGDR
ncbi:MAG: hypothetical protein JXL80_11285 [Planctomycetes bacterium]|nr:hypothetical protein [Planctomycetota bacterium]